MSEITVTMHVDKIVKNSIRFAETVSAGEAKVPSLYIPKTTLNELGWEEGQELKLSVEV